MMHLDLYGRLICFISQVTAIGFEVQPTATEFEPTTT